MISEEWLAKELSSLPANHYVAFAASCAERLKQNYTVFVLVEKWGDAKRIQAILDIVWSLPGTSSIEQMRIQELMQECMELCPETEDFPSFYGSLAMHAVEAIYYTFVAYINNDVQGAVLASRAVFDSLDVYLHTVNFPIAGIHSHNPVFDAWIMETPLVIAEITKQRYDLDVLGSSLTLSAELLQNMRLSAGGVGIQMIERGIVRG